MDSSNLEKNSSSSSANTEILSELKLLKMKIFTLRILTHADKSITRMESTEVESTEVESFGIEENPSVIELSSDSNSDIEILGKLKFIY